MPDYQFELRGSMPMLHHNNNLDGQAEVKEWIGGETGSKLSVAGDDRSPTWTWTASLYRGEEFVAIPQHCIMAALRIGGSKVKNGSSTWAKPSQFGMGIKGPDNLDLLVGGNKIPLEPIIKLKEKYYNAHPSDFAKHHKEVEKLGFRLQVVPVKNPATRSRNIRVRPLFDDWSIVGTIGVRFPEITPEILQRIFNAAGLYGGLGDWSPHAGKPGPYGTFDTVLKLLAAKKSA